MSIIARNNAHIGTLFASVSKNISAGPSRTMGKMKCKTYKNTKSRCISILKQEAELTYQPTVRKPLTVGFFNAG